MASGTVEGLVLHSGVESVKTIRSRCWEESACFSSPWEELVCMEAEVLGSSTAKLRASGHLFDGAV